MCALFQIKCEVGACLVLVVVIYLGEYKGALVHAVHINRAYSAAYTRSGVAGVVVNTAELVFACFGNIYTESEVCALTAFVDYISSRNQTAA